MTTPDAITLDHHWLHVGDQVWPVHPDDVDVSDWPPPHWPPLELDEIGFVHRTRAVKVRFENGWTASVIWGTGTYSSNHDTMLHGTEFTETPTAVEVGLLCKGDLRLDPLGYVTADELNALLAEMAIWSTSITDAEIDDRLCASEVR